MLTLDEDVRDGALASLGSESVLDRCTITDLIELLKTELDSLLLEKRLGTVAVRAVAL